MAFMTLQNIRTFRLVPYAHRFCDDIYSVAKSMQPFTTELYLDISVVKGILCDR